MAHNILAINPGHNGSVALVSDGKLAYYCEEERMSRLKHDGNPFRAMLSVLNSLHVHELVIGGTTNELPQLPWTREDPYSALVRKFNPQVKITKMGHLHHLGHAAAGFYGSGFDTAVTIVIDGAGSYHQEKIDDNQSTGGFETETIYYTAYPHEFNAVYKRYSDGKSPHFDNGVQEFDPSVTLTKVYEAVTHYLGFGFIEAGKTMGLSAYGVEDSTLPNFFVGNKANSNLLIPAYPGGALLNEHRFPGIMRFSDQAAWHNDPALIRDVDKNLAFKVQQEAELQLFRLVQKALDITGETNVVLSGGFALNCVANYKLLARFPNINFYIDPIAHDGGSSIGLALYAHYQNTKSLDKSPVTTLYLGNPPEYATSMGIIEAQLTKLKISDASPADAAALLAAGTVVAMFQGRAEGGPRALGNRSLLFDPSNPNGKDIVNAIKRREWFRPFAASILEENVHDWFDIGTLPNSPYMMYAVKVWDEIPLPIPAVIHADGTCRVQTVTAESNPAYYQIISEFKELTGLPLVLNTSFNLAGEPLVDTLFDAVNTLANSELTHLYLPDIGKIISK